MSTEHLSPNGKPLKMLSQNKRDAYAMRVENPQMSRGHCFEFIAKDLGFNSYSALVAYCKPLGLDDRKEK